MTTGSSSMNAAELCEQYRDALSKKDLPAIQALFTPDAVVKAPISGTATVGQFHAYLFSNTNKTVARFPNFLGSRNKPGSVTLQFSYTLSIANGDAIVLDGAAVFEVDESLGKFKSLTIVYDASDLRRFMQDAGITAPPSAG